MRDEIAVPGDNDCAAHAINETRSTMCEALRAHHPSLHLDVTEIVTHTTQDTRKERVRLCEACDILGEASAKRDSVRLPTTGTVTI